MPPGRIFPAAVFLLCYDQRKESTRRVPSPGQSIRWQAKGFCLSEFWQTRPAAPLTLWAQQRYKAQVAQKNFLKSPEDEQFTEPLSCSASCCCLTWATSDEPLWKWMSLFRWGWTSDGCFIKCSSVKAVAFRGAQVLTVQRFVLEYDFKPSGFLICSAFVTRAHSDKNKLFGFYGLHGVRWDFSDIRQLYFTRCYETSP